MNPQEMTRKVLRELAADRASHGHGEAALIDERMNKARGYLGRIIRGDLGLHVETLFEALEALEVDAADFFGRVTGARVCPDRLLRRLERRAPAGARSVLGRFEIEVDGDRIEVTAGFDDPLPGEDLAQRLEELDEVLFSFPDRALGSAEEVLLAAVHRLRAEPCTENLDFVSRALGALAAAYRVHARFGPAARCLRIGLRLCEVGGLKATRADLLQRTGYLAGDQGEYDLAVEISRQASDEYLTLGHPRGIGKALVDRAIFLRRAGHPEAALEMYQISLGYLESKPGKSSDWRTRYSVYQGLGSVLCQLDEIAEARGYLRKATDAHRTKEGQNWWRLIALGGEVALKDGDTESAEQAFLEARDGFAEIGNPFDVAVVSLRLAEAVLSSGRLTEVQRIAADMMRLLKPLEQHKVACAAIYEFTRAALAGEVTVDLVSRLSNEIQDSAPVSGASETL